MLNHLKVKFWRFLYIFPHSDVSSRTQHFVGRSCCTAVNREDALRRPLVLRLGEKMVTHRFHVPLQGVNGHKCSQLCVCLRRLIIINVVAPPPSSFTRSPELVCSLSRFLSERVRQAVWSFTCAHTPDTGAATHTYAHKEQIQCQYVINFCLVNRDLNCLHISFRQFSRVKGQPSRSVST